MTLDQFLAQFGASLDQGVSLLGFAVAFLAGIVASGVCPCTLPMGLGMASAAGASEAESRRSGCKIATSFFAGIVINLTFLGVLAGRLGALATESFGRYWALGMALLSVAAAAFVFSGPRLKVSQLQGWRRPGVIGAFGYGFVFSLGTSLAPLLLLLTVSAGMRSPALGLLLAFTFGLGRGFPFLIAGVAGSAITGFTRLGTWGRSIQVVSGCALLFVGLYYTSVFIVLL
jgi:cytochrome c-type biogenesis protein